MHAQTGEEETELNAEEKLAVCWRRLCMTCVAVVTLCVLACWDKQEAEAFNAKLQRKVLELEQQVDRMRRGLFIHTTANPGKQKTLHKQSTHRTERQKALDRDENYTEPQPKKTRRTS